MRNLISQACFLGIERRPKQHLLLNGTDFQLAYISTALAENSPVSTKEDAKISKGTLAGPARQVNAITVIFQGGHEGIGGAGQCRDSPELCCRADVERESLQPLVCALPGEEFRPALLESFMLVQSQHQKFPFYLEAF